MLSPLYLQARSPDKRMSEESIYSFRPCSPIPMPARNLELKVSSTSHLNKQAEVTRSRDQWNSSAAFFQAPPTKCFQHYHAARGGIPIQLTDSIKEGITESSPQSTSKFNFSDRIADQDAIGELSTNISFKTVTGAIHD